MLFNRCFIALGCRGQHNRANYALRLDVHTGGLAAGEGTFHCRDDILAPRYQLAMPAKAFEHRVEGNIPKIRGKMPAALEQPFLLLGDTVKAAIIVDDDGDRPVLLKGRLDRQPARQEGARRR